MGRYKVIAENLNVREEPKLTGKIIGVLEKDEEVTCLSISGDGYWYRIAYRDNLVGWSAPKREGVGAMRYHLVVTSLASELTQCDSAMRSNISKRIIAAGICVLFVLAGINAEATTLIQPVLTAAQSNVVFRDIGGGNVEITLDGVFDFSSIGGGSEVYSGTFVYDTSVPPFSTPPDPDVAIAFYKLNVINFSILGNAVTPIRVDVLIQDGAGIFNDFFTLQVTLDLSDGPGLPITGASQGLVAIGLNAGAFPGTMFSSTAFPTNLDIFASATGAGAPTQFAEVSFAPSIDIKPGSFPNSVNPKSNGVIPVAVLTTDTFDATTIDPNTVRFGSIGTEAAPVHAALEDVDGDGDTDMILHFKTQDTGIECGDTFASLTGETFGGQAFKASDSINTVACGG